MTQTVPRRGRAGPIGLVVLVLVVVLIGLLAFRRDPVVRADRPVGPDRPETSVGVHPGRWARVDSPPLTPRWGAAGGWVGGRLLVVGGAVGAACDQGRCPAPVGARDGASYDPAARTWTALPEAPVPVPPGSLTTSAGGEHLVVRTGASWLAYDRARLWRRLPAPDLDAQAISSVGGDRVYALGSSGQVAMLDLVTRSWRDLPRPPGRAIESPALVADRAGVSLVGSDPRGQRVDRRLVDRWNGTSWARASYPLPGRLAGPFGVWRDVDPAPGPAASGWVSLPAGDDRPLTSGTGYVWDTAENTWVGLGRPDGPSLSQPAVVYAAARIYLVGGYDAHGDPSAHAWVWTP